MSAIDNALTEPRPGVLPLPEGWIPLAPQDADPGEWVEGYLDQLEVQPTPIARAQLRYGLLSLMEMASGMRPGKRYNYAFVEDPTAGLVRALLTVQMLRVTPDAFENYRTRLAETDLGGDIEVINRTVQDVHLVAGRGLVMHDFTLTAQVEAVPDPALERAILGLFVADRDVMIEFALYAQDLAVFEDMVDYLVKIVAVLDFTGVAQ